MWKQCFLHEFTNSMKQLSTILLCLLISIFTYSQEFSVDSVKQRLSSSYTAIYRETLLRPGRVFVDSIAVDNRRKSIELYTNLSLSYLPMRDATVQKIYDSTRYYLPSEYKKHRLSVFSDNQEISHLVPNFYRDKQVDKNRIIAHKVKVPLITRVSDPAGTFPKGMPNNHLALWQSHGWYYEQKLGRWEWQRARIFQTVEDLYTQSYVVPFLVPMLENAGANVLLPRERDYNRVEIIVDNDKGTGNSQYREKNGKEPWRKSLRAGFSHEKSIYLDGENPFKMGTVRETNTVTRGEASMAEWLPDFPKSGEYGVYIAYQTLKNSSDDALYTVHHDGGTTEFRVNQQMGGGTWIYLGSFYFNENGEHKITLSNAGRRAGRVVTADAVKIGGGMGNIARMPHADGYEERNTKSSEPGVGVETVIPKIHYEPEISGYPRYTEGARYWMQWAGVPDTVYNRTEGKNDYTDDYASRGVWVNWLSGGSSVLPEEEGLNIPVDLALAFHTDAGTFWGDTIVGTLGIYMANHNDGFFENGKSRWASRDLTELVMDEITNDIRREFEPEWTRRHLWNRSYAEARIPNVPTMLLELLSHQNFADMRYGLDPTFRFTVSRSIYKGLLKFLATQYNRSYVVQPLPVKDFHVQFTGDNQVELAWEPTPDPAEPTATPSGYVVYTRINGSGFDNGIMIQENRLTISIHEGDIYSFKVVAVNEGGKSFPSEILSASRQSNSPQEVLIVNGFTRLSAPFSFTTSEDSLAGFAGSVDNGVPYMADHHFIGQMNEFRRVIPWMDDDASGFGDSFANYETTAIAGNTFDYPYIHGIAFTEAGYSFVSTSASAVEKRLVNLNDYPVVDWILGKQREGVVAHGAMPPKYKTFSKEAMEAITNFCDQGGNILVSGAFVGTDFWDNPYATEEDRLWANETLKFRWRNNNGAVMGKIKAVASPFPGIEGIYTYYNTLNSKGYVVENPDAIEPADERAFTIFRYAENNLSAGVMYRGEDYNTCILGFPIESIKEQQERNLLIKQVMSTWNE